MKMPCRMKGEVYHEDGVIPDKEYVQRHLERRKGYETPLKNIPNCEPNGSENDLVNEPKEEDDDLQP